MESSRDEPRSLFDIPYANQPVGPPSLSHESAGLASSPLYLLSALSEPPRSVGRAHRSSRPWLEFFIKSLPLDNGNFSCVSRWNAIFIGRDSQTPRAPTRVYLAPPSTPSNWMLTVLSPTSFSLSFLSFSLSLYIPCSPTLSTSQKQNYFASFAHFPLLSVCTGVSCASVCTERYNNSLVRGIFWAETRTLLAG